MNMRKIGIASLFLVLIVVCISVFWKYDLFLTGILVLLAYSVQKVSPVKKSFMWFVVMGILGPTIESLIISFGSHPWTYAMPFFMHVPRWLCAFYGLAGIVIIVLYQGITQIDKK